MCLVKIEGKAIEKLIDVVSKGIGTIYKPRAIRKGAEAEAYKNEVLAKAQAKKTLIEGEAKIDLLERAKERLVNQELHRQMNLEGIADKSIKYLDQNVADQPVDEDWRIRFFNKAQDISSDEMQEIWAKILAGEVSHPGKVSLRTLEILSNISKTEATIFQVACSLATSKSFIWKIGRREAFDEFGLSYGDLMLLREAGLIHDSDNLIKIYRVTPPTNFVLIFIGEELYQFSNPAIPDLKEFKFNQIAFTNSGTELCSLIKVNSNNDFHKTIYDQRISEGLKLEKIHRSKWTT